MSEKFETVLVGSDFSEESIAACRYAAQIARMSDAHLILFHAFHVAQGDMMDDRGRKMHFEDAKDRARQRLEDIRTQHLDSYDKAEVDLRVGDPATELIKYANETKPSLVVTATRRRSKVAEQLLGSVADKVARNVRCPIMIVPPDVSW